MSNLAQLKANPAPSRTPSTVASSLPARLHPVAIQPVRAELSRLETPGLELPRLGILNDYVRIPYANGSSFASQFLYREFRKRGSEVTVIGPNDPKAVEADLPPNRVCFSALPFRNHPGVQLAFPNRTGLKQLVDANLSLLVAQTGSALMHAGVWLRRNAGVPLVCVNTIHLPSVYDVLLPKAIHQNRFVVNLFQKRLIPWVERTSAQLYNEGDGLVVLSEGLKDYWRERGVTVPISVIPRSVDPNVFDQRPEWDPFPAHARKGSRLLVVCRHTREKNVERLLELFAAHIAPVHPEATLTLVGDGPDHDAFRALAERLGIAQRCHFPGEVTLTDTPAWYRHADLFVYTSQSETYGQVVSEALWCGLPVVAMADGKGVSDQVVHGSDGFLIEPSSPGADAAFARAALGLLLDPAQRALFSERAQAKARLRSDPQRCVRAYEEAFSAAIEHRNRTARRKSAFARRAPLLSWTGLHLLLAVLGCLRAPAKVNRNGRRQPDWDAFESLDVPKALPA